MDENDHFRISVYASQCDLFIEAAECLLNPKTKQVRFGDAFEHIAIINGLFAIELGLKYLLASDARSVQKTHNLSFLFNNLNAGHKQAVKELLTDIKRCPGQTIPITDFFKLSEDYGDLRYEGGHLLIDVRSLLSCARRLHKYCLTHVPNEFRWIYSYLI